MHTYHTNTYMLFMNQIKRTGDVDTKFIKVGLIGNQIEANRNRRSTRPERPRVIVTSGSDMEVETIVQTKTYKIRILKRKNRIEGNRGEGFHREEERVAVNHRFTMRIADI